MNFLSKTDIIGITNVCNKIIQNIIIFAFPAYNIVKHKGNKMMGMPKIDCKDIDIRCAATSILQSIALQEAALAHIINAEGEKIQRAISMDCIDLKDLVEVNESVTEMIEKITALENVLKNKAELIIPLLEEEEEESFPWPKPHDPCDKPHYGPKPHDPCDKSHYGSKPYGPKPCEEC